MTRCDIPQDRRPHLRRFESLKASFLSVDCSFWLCDRSRCVRQVYSFRQTELKITMFRSGSYWSVSMTVQTKNVVVQVQCMSRNCLCCSGIVQNISVNNARLVR